MQWKAKVLESDDLGFDPNPAAFTSCYLGNLVKCFKPPIFLQLGYEEHIG